MIPHDLDNSQSGATVPSKNPSVRCKVPCFLLRCKFDSVFSISSLGRWAVFLCERAGPLVLGYTYCQPWLEDRPESPTRTSAQPHCKNARPTHGPSNVAGFPYPCELVDCWPINQVSVQSTQICPSRSHSAQIGPNLPKSPKSAQPGPNRQSA